MGWVCRKHSDETRLKFRQSSKHLAGEQNGMFGTCWIFSLAEKKSIVIKQEQLDEYLAKGWIKGRKIRFA